MNWHKMDEYKRISMMEPPKTYPAPCVLDTDTYNEIDDQFCLSWALLDSDIDLKAIYAAPYHNDRSSGPGDGMEKSYKEIFKLLEFAGINMDGKVFRGSKQFMPQENTVVESESARHLVEISKDYNWQNPLYVLAIGCPANVSSAILIDPSIIERIVVVWLGGQPHNWAHANEFNLMQDVYSSRVLFDSGVPMIQLPCLQVTDHLTMTIPELEYFSKRFSKLGKYLCDCTIDYINERYDDTFCVSKVVWDIVAVSWLVNPDSVTTVLTSSPVLNMNKTYSFDRSRHQIREGITLDRDAVFKRLFLLLKA